jgi:hypothetical protein
MATIATTASLKRLYTPFTGLSAIERSQSGIARAEIVYYNVNDSWAAPGAGNNRIYQSGILDLPKDFGYVLTDATCKIESSGNINVNAASLLTLFPGGILGPQINLTLNSDGDRQDENGNTAIGTITAQRFNNQRPVDSAGDGAMIHHLSRKTTALLYPFGSSTYTSDPNPATSWQWVIGEQSTGS